MDDNMSKSRKRARTRREWLEILRNLPPEASSFEREVVEYALRKRDHFPRPPLEVKRLVEATVNIQGQEHVPVHMSNNGCAPPMIMHQPVAAPTVAAPTIVVPQQHLDINISELMQHQGDERSMGYLQSLAPPANYNPCPSLDELHDSFEQNGYFLNRDDIFSIHQALLTGRPVKVDGPPGTGKTELAKQIAIAMGLECNNPLHFGELFCTPDITKSEAFYGWNDARRLVDMQLVSNLSARMDREALKKAYIEVANNAYSPRYLDLQALVRACVIPYRTVVLVDEVDKTYHEFDNYLLTVVDQNRFVVPEYGAVGRPQFDPKTSPIFVLTSNMTRSLSGPLVRRCKAMFYDYLPENLEERVIRAKTGMDRMEAGLIAHFFKKVRGNRQLHLQQPPSTAEVIETARALKETGLEVKEQNILRLHCHWIKYRVDFGAVQNQFKDGTGDWFDNIPDN